MLSDGKTECYVEVVSGSWDSVVEVGEIWVKVPTLSATEDTILYLYYDSDHEDNTEYVGLTGSVPAQNVWDSNFKLVCHMNDNPDTSHIKDSTSNGNDGVKKGANEPIEANGIIGEAQDFDGNDDIITFSDTPFDAVSALTLECWYKVDSGVTNNYFMHKDDGSVRAYTLKHDTRFRFFIWDSGGVLHTTIADDVFVAGTAYYVVGTYDGTTQKLYVNGVLQAGTATWSDTIKLTNVDFVMGGFGEYYAKGDLDEARVSIDYSRSSAWVGASYETQRDQFINYIGFKHHREVIGDWTPKGGRK